MTLVYVVLLSNFIVLNERMCKMEQRFLDHIGEGADDLYLRAVSQPLSFKIEQALNLLRLWEPSDGYYLAYSGGKDSGAILRLAQMACVKYEAWYNVTTLDSPELVRFVKNQGSAIHWNRTSESLLTKVVSVKGPPTRLNRWCCAIYKEMGGYGRVKILGVRAEESRTRKGNWKQVSYHRKTGKPIICPVLYWTDADIWSFHAQEKLPYCELYDQGFERLGCIGCPMSGAYGLVRDFNRWPRYEKLWKRAVIAHWDKWHGVPTRTGTVRWSDGWEDGEAFWRWWKSRKKKPNSNAGSLRQMELPGTGDDQSWDWIGEDSEDDGECQGQSLFV